MIKLVERFQEALDARRGILECFCNYGVQLEGWLKGELLYFLNADKAVGTPAVVQRLSHRRQTAPFPKESGQRIVDDTLVAAILI